MTTRIPNKDKRFSVHNSSLSLGNVYGTWNWLPYAEKGKIRLNHPLLKLYSTTSNADFSKVIAITLAQKNSGAGVDCYVAAEKTGSNVGYVWSVGQGSLTKLTGTSAPAKVDNDNSDMTLAFGTDLVVSDVDGLHHVADSSSGGNWTLESASEFQSNKILVYFQEQNRLYMINASRVYSCSNGYASATSGSFTIASGFDGVSISCARPASKRIWIGASGVNNAPLSKIFEWDGVQSTPLNIFRIPTTGIQNIVILNDQPIAIDNLGRLWFYDGYQFSLKEAANIPIKPDDFGQTCMVHRNGSFAEGGQAYFLIAGGGTNGLNSSERGIAGVWCYDPKIGFFHFSSPDNNSRLIDAYALSQYTREKTIIAGYWGSTSGTTGEAKLATTETTSGLGGALRRGSITTQFIEAQSITDAINHIVVKYREVIDTTNFSVEVKYRKKKNQECNTSITWTSATTFTCLTADLAGTGTYYNTQVVVGDEVMVQMGTNAGLIAHITAMSDNAGTTTVTIDRSATTTSGAAYALISNFKYLGNITSGNTDKVFKDFKLAEKGEKTTMIQVKLVMSWKGYFDEVQEILVLNQAWDKLT